MRMRTLVLCLSAYTVPQAPPYTPTNTTPTVRLAWNVRYCSDPRPLSLFPLRSFPTRPTKAAGLFRPCCPAMKLRRGRNAALVGRSGSGSGGFGRLGAALRNVGGVFEWLSERVVCASLCGRCAMCLPTVSLRSLRGNQCGRAAA